MNERTIYDSDTTGVANRPPDVHVPMSSKQHTNYALRRQSEQLPSLHLVLLRTLFSMYPLDSLEKPQMSCCLIQLNLP